MVRERRIPSTKRRRAEPSGSGRSGSGPSLAVCESHGPNGQDLLAATALALEDAGRRDVGIVVGDDARSPEAAGALAARLADRLAALAADLADGQLVLPIASTFPLDAVVDAFRALDAPHPPGKVVVLP